VKSFKKFFWGHQQERLTRNELNFHPLTGAIQIIRNTQGGGMTMCHTYIFTFWNTGFKASGSEKFCLTARIGLKRHSFILNFKAN
jgi:hypothetical protein